MTAAERTDDTTIARALAHAAALGDAHAAHLAAVAPATIASWRRRHGARLRPAVALELRELARSWRTTLGALAGAASAELAARIAGTSDRTEPASRELISLVRGLAEGLTAAGALLRHEDTADDDEPRGVVQ